MGWVVWFGVAWGQDVPASTVTVTLAEAVARSAAVASITGADASERVAESRKDQAGAGRMPSIGVSGSVNVWNAEQVVSLLPSDAPLDCSVFPAEFAGLCEGFGEPLVVRNQVTATLTARAGIPLTGQFAIDRRIKAADAGVDAAHAQGLSARVDARYQAEEAWFVALQAESQLAIAEAQVQSLGERVHSAQVGFDQGAATRNDVLKAELALARAEQAVIQVRTLRDAAYGRLGLATASGGVPARPIGDPPPPPEPEVEIEALVSRAVEARPELAALRAQVRAADEAARAASLDRLPQVGAVERSVAGDNAIDGIAHRKVDDGIEFADRQIRRNLDQQRPTHCADTAVRRCK
ncbi:MAG: TolC family protein [Myxococcota bacterium]